MNSSPNYGLLFAVLAAVSASLVGVFAKIGMEGIPPLLATAVRSVVMMLFCIVVAGLSGASSKLGTLHGKAITMIVLSGIAGATSWVFGFLAYDYIGVAKTAPIDKLSVPLAVVLAFFFLGERPTWYNWVGVFVIVVGAYLAALPKPRPSVQTDSTSAAAHSSQEPIIAGSIAGLEPANEIPAHPSSPRSREMMRD